jgi:biotin transport system substrate-specific component
MNKEFSAPSALWPTSTSAYPWLRAAAVVLAGSALLAVCAHVAIPLWFTPVPLTLQPFAVLLLGLLLSPRLATATLAAYLLEGAAGLPVFSAIPALTSGVAHLIGPTGGYLMTYPIAAMLISFLWQRAGRGFSWALASAALGDLMILLGGALWFAASTHTAPWAVISLAVLPFLPGDALKVVAAAALASGFHRLRLRTSKPRPTS